VAGLPKVYKCWNLGLASLLPELSSRKWCPPSDTMSILCRGLLDTSEPMN